jgi:endonuclease/exonuclease/phosphatase family metal-dependent hydrolase
MNFGKSKSDEQIGFIAAAIKRVDILLIQEVVAEDPGGAKAVARLGEALNKTGTKWEYRISDPTSGNNSYKKERYAIFWKPSIVTLIGKPWLEKNYQHEIDREPYYASFKCGTKEFTVVNFHAITKSMQPETEIKYFRNLPAAYPRLNLLFFGDFNLPQSHSVFYPLKTMGYTAAFTNQKTSLKQNCAETSCLSAELDNCFYSPKKIKMNSSRVLHFYKAFPNFKEARSISDHIPIVVEFECN